jgi:hypothetical protein
MPLKWLFGSREKDGTFKPAAEETNPDTCAVFGMVSVAAKYMPALIFGYTDRIESALRAVGIAAEPRRKFILLCNAAAMTTGVLMTQAVLALRPKVREGKIQEKTIEEAADTIARTALGNFVTEERQQAFRHLLNSGHLRTRAKDLQDYLAPMIRSTLDAMIAVANKQKTASTFMADQVIDMAIRASVPQKDAAEILNVLTEHFNPSALAAFEEMRALAAEI